MKNPLSSNKALIILLFFVVFLYSLFFPYKVLALAQWKEDFEGLNEDTWKIYQNEGEINLNNSWLILSSYRNTFPYLHLKNNLSVSSSSCDLEIKFKYNDLAPWGTGISIGNSLIQNGLPLEEYDPTNENGSSVRVWTESTGDFRIVYRDCDQKPCTLTKLYSTSTNTEIHFLKMKLSQTGEAEVIIDNINLGKVKFPNSFKVWIGNPLSVSFFGPWTQIEIDYLKYSCGETNSPIIIIPGLGASWETEAILKGVKKSQEEWRMTPFVNIYDNLIATLENAGYQQGEDLFIFNYDWRQPLEETAEELENFIDNHLPPDEKVNLIGHSLGGLVSRAYWQTQGEEKVEKIITLGTPHQGAIQAYEALAGGRVSKKLDWAGVAMNLLLQLRTPLYQTKAATLREEIPVLYQLLPVFDFARQGKRVISWKSLSFKNSYLEQINQNLPSLERLNFISGNTGYNTDRWLLFRSPSALEKLLGLWPDGFPYRSLKGIGDGTVLLKSSYLEKKEPFVFTIAHRYLPHEKEVIEKVLDILDLQASVSEETVPFSPDNSLLFMIASPTQLKIISPKGEEITANEQGFVFLPFPSAGEYRAVLEGKSSGKYHLVVGQLFENSYWNTYQGEISSGEIKEYYFEINPSSPKDNPLKDNLTHLFEITLRELGVLNNNYSSSPLEEAISLLEAAKTAAQEENWSQSQQKTEEALKKIFLFRQENYSLYPLNESQRVISLFAEILSSLKKKQGDLSLGEAKNEYLKARRRGSLAWRLIRLKKRRKTLDKLSLISYYQGDQLIKKAKSFLKEKNSPSLAAYSFTAQFFFEEI